MAIRPIDAQLMIQKVPEVSQLYTNNHASAQARLGGFAQEFKREIDTQGQQVNETDEAEQRQVDKDGKNGGKRQDRQKRGQNKQDKQAPKQEAKPEGSSFSIRG